MNTGTCWLNEDCVRGRHDNGDCIFPPSLSAENAELREIDRRALRAAVAALLKRADEAERSAGEGPAYVGTAFIRRVLEPWTPAPINQEGTDG